MGANIIARVCMGNVHDYLLFGPVCAIVGVSSYACMHASDNMRMGMCRSRNSGEGWLDKCCYISVCLFIKQCKLGLEFRALHRLNFIPLMATSVYHPVLQS